ncbi:MAG TPA: septum formation initiator family protein, partial [Nitrospira sp.]|nr:septum formation initiator family protein [Nitrospira sp.]
AAALLDSLFEQHQSSQVLISMIVKRNRGREWLDWQRRWVTGAQYIGAGMCLLLLLALFFGEMGIPRYFSMRDHAQQLGRDIQDLQRATTVLRGEIDRLEHDPARIEQLARERLGYVRKGETVYQVVPDGSEERVRP